MGGVRGGGFPDKGITLSSSEASCIFRTCVFRNHPLGEGRDGEESTGILRARVT